MHRGEQGGTRVAFGEARSREEGEQMNLLVASGCAILILAPGLSMADVLGRTEGSITVEIDGPDSLEEEAPPDRIDIERHESGVLLVFRNVEAREACVEGSFTAWRPSPMRPENGTWTCERRLKKGTYRFRVLYRIPGDDRWFEEPPPGEDAPVGSRWLYTLEVEDREISWYEEEAKGHAVDGGFGATYNRVEGLHLSYALEYERGLRRTARVRWSQAYSFAAERWSWEAKTSLPAGVLSGLFFEAEGFDHLRVPTAWTVSETENFAAALLLNEDFFDYVWSRGWFTRLVYDRGSHLLSGGYGEVEDEPIAKNTEWSLFGRGKEFRENLFAAPPGVEGKNHRVEGRYEYDNRNYGDTPTLGWLLGLQADYAGWELGGDHDYWRGIAEIRRYQKLMPGLQLDFRALGGTSRGDVPLQELFRIGGVGTMRAHRLKELAGTRLFLANVESRIAVWNELHIAFFADLGDAWRTEERREFDLESDMGFGLMNKEGDLRIDFARRLDRGADADLVVTARLARMF
jgi:hypothetical protein